MDEKQFFYDEDTVSESVEQVETNQSWFSDDFEEQYKNAVSPKKSLAIYKPKPKKNFRFFKNPVFASVISSVVTCCICAGIFSFVAAPKEENKKVPSLSIVQNSGGEISQLATSTATNLTIPQVYELVSPTVVTIICETQGAYVQSTMSSGSGIILTQDGYIVTNNHVIEGATQITVNTIAGQSFDAKVVGADARTDLAVLKVDSADALPYAQLGDSSTVRVGEVALAIGNPLREELAGTLTVGYISAINRSMVIDGKQMTMIQTDAAINPGNSGGALLNGAGQVIGINTAKSTGYDVEGLGFAIPINDAVPIIESIIEHGYVTGRVTLGIMGQSITEAISQARNLPIGVYVKEVSALSAAERAGVKVGDVILSCDGTKVATVDDINAIKEKHKVGETMTLRVNRNGQELTLKAILQEEKPETEEQKSTQTQQGQQYESYFPFSWFGW